MKIQITRHQEKVLKLLSSSGGDLLMYISSGNQQEAFKYITALLEQYPDFDFKAAIVEKQSTFLYEYIVMCVQKEWYDILDLIFNANHVSPDFVSRNGSPLLLFAMQTSVEMFRYILSRGAKLVIHGDLVKNHDKPYLTALFCANGNPDMLQLLFNAGLRQVGSTVTNKETLALLLHLGISLEREHSQLRDFIRIHNMGTFGYKPTWKKTCRFQQEDDTPRGKMIALVNSGCTSTDDFRKAGENCTPSDIRACMAVAMSRTEAKTFTSLWYAYPQHSF